MTLEVIAHRGHFVLISSVFAFLNGMGTIPYAMSKAAVEQLGRGQRVELAAHGVSTTTARWKPLSALRGLINPALDSRLVRDWRTLAALSRLDARSPTAPTPQNLPMSLPAHTIKVKGTQ